MNAPQAIAAMSLNRVIGASGRIPWHLPQDFKWFKRTTTGHVLLMGRRTFESIGRPLPDRQTFVLTRSAFACPGVRVLARLEDLAPVLAGHKVFICGGAEVYAQTLAYCSDLYLTVVRREVPGDTLFPSFEHIFTLTGTLAEEPEFRILHYQNTRPLPWPGASRPRELDASSG
jgi:dihydrofolate reductase